MQITRHTAALGLTVAAVLMVPSCATNPVTGKSQLAMITEQQEIAMGQQADRDVVASIGLYGDDALQRYVTALGMPMAKASERPNLPWTFRVVDDPSVNAFAIPGGFIYVTRGILAHLNSEAELIGVLGHEIGHVTARHSVSQMSKQQLAGLGLGIAMIASPEARAFGDLAQFGLQTLFLRFSRQHEMQADELGFRYALDGGYDPRSLGEMFTVLERVGAQTGGARLPNWLSTHPDPANRRAWVEKESAAVAATRDLSSLRVERASYQRRLDGLIFGENPREGFFEQSLFHHPELAFRMNFPPGWTTQNQKAAVAALSPQKDAQLVLELAPAATPAEAAQKFFAQQGIVAEQPWRNDVNGFRTTSYVFAATTQKARLRGLVAWIADGDRVYQILGYTLAERWSTYGQAFSNAIGSFERERDREILAAQPRRLKMEEVGRASTLEELIARYPSSVTPQTVALINHLDAGERVASGSLFKRVVGTVPGG